MNITDILADMAELPEFCNTALPLRVDSVGNFGNAPLNIAATQGNLAAVESLLEAGANINHQGEHGYTPLHDAVEQNNEDIIHLLLEKGASSNLVNEEGLDAAALASLLGFPACNRK